MHAYLYKFGTSATFYGICVVQNKLCFSITYCLNTEIYCPVWCMVDYVYFLNNHIFCEYYVSCCLSSERQDNYQLKLWYVKSHL